MSVSASSLRRLAALNLSKEQMAGVLEILCDMLDADIKRRAVEAERTKRYRDRLGISSVEWQDLAARVKERDGYQCQYCGSRLAPMHADHVIPLIKGGTNDPTNLVTACEACNCGKGGRLLEEWRAASDQA